MTRFKQTVLLAILLCIGLNAKAYDFKVDGIAYSITSDSTVAVVSRGYGISAYSGTLNIPSTVTYQGTTYSVTSIGNAACYYCTELTDVRIGSNVKSIGNYAFELCTGLTDLRIGNSVTTIGMYTFFGCTELTNVGIPNSVTSIGLEAFYGCTGLTNLTIGSSITSIGDETFGNCT